MERAYALKGKVVKQDQIINNGLVIVEDQKIIYAGPIDQYKNTLPAKQEKVMDGWICPGFIDIHTHGAGGFDTMDGTPEAVEGLSRHLVRYGVTSFLATTMTSEYQRLLHVVGNVAQVAKHFRDGADIIGIHLEGPWINREFKGAQNEKYIAVPAIEEARTLLERAEGLIRIVTIAPEVENAAEVISFLASNGVVVSAGHTGATFDDVASALPHGLKHITHCFNGMTGLHHREPGTVGAAMYFDELSAELIADGIHVHPATMSILHRVKSSKRLTLISDSMRAAGLGEGIYDLGGQEVHVNNGKAQLADGTIAGSVLTLNRAVENMVKLCAVPFADAVHMASTTPAEVLGVANRKGKLEKGYEADLIILTSDYEVAATYVRGKLVYSV